MRRRTMLGALGSGIAVLAGCSGGPEAEPAGAATETTGPGTELAGGAEPSPASTEADRPAERTPEEGNADRLRLLSVEAPPRVQLGEPARYRFTVENPAEAPQTVEPTVNARRGSSGWTGQDGWEPVEVPAGGRHTFESSTFTNEFLETVELRISQFDAVFPVEFVEKQLPLSEGYRDPLGREVAVEDVSVQSSYTYTRDDEYRVVELDGDLTFVFLDVEVVNRTDGSLQAPPRGSFTLMGGDETHYSIPMEGDAGYEARELSWGSRASGRVAFKTPGSLSSDDFRIRWRESFDGGDVGVIWTPD